MGVDFLYYKKKNQSSLEVNIISISIQYLLFNTITSHKTLTPNNRLSSNINNHYTKLIPQNFQFKYPLTIIIEWNHRLVQKIKIWSKSKPRRKKNFTLHELIGKLFLLKKIYFNEIK